MADAPQIIVLDPRAEGGSDAGTLAPRLAGLDGRRVSLLWNSKKNGDVVLRGALEGIRETGVEVDDRWFKKMMFEPLADSLVEEVVEVSEAAILALSD